MKKNILLIILSLVILFSLGFYFLFNHFSKKESVTGLVIGGDNLDNFAKCLSSRGAKMYGAFWCGYCNKQKESFGESFKFIDYVECDAKGDNANPSSCQEAGIRGYPTWIINNVHYSGFQSLENLAKLTNCKLNLE